MRGNNSNGVRLHFWDGGAEAGSIFLMQEEDDHMTRAVLDELAKLLIDSKRQQDEESS